MYVYIMHHVSRLTSSNYCSPKTYVFCEIICNLSLRIRLALIGATLAHFYRFGLDGCPHCQLTKGVLKCMLNINIHLRMPPLLYIIAELTTPFEA